MPPRLPISSLRKGLAVVTATGLIGAATVFGAATADAATTQTGSCVDGGGIRWTAKAIWGGTYTSGGVRKISINYAGWTTNGRAVPTDSTVRSYSGDGTRIQKLTWSGVYDYKGGTAYRVRNPLNPASAPGKAPAGSVGRSEWGLPGPAVAGGPFADLFGAWLTAQWARRRPQTPDASGSPLRRGNHRQPTPPRTPPRSPAAAGPGRGARPAGSPTGRPSGVRPAGTEIAGQPVTVMRYAERIQSR